MGVIVMLDLIKKQFEPKETWLIIKEGSIGLECFAHKDLCKLSKPNKALLKSFLEGVLFELK